MAREVRVGSAVVGFRADVRQFLQGLNQSQQAARRQAQALRRLQRQVRRLQNDFNRTARSIISFRSAVGLLAGGAGIGLIVSRSAEAGAALFELSVRTGETVENLQTLGRVFEGDGVSGDQFNKLIINLAKNLGAARSGLTQYARIFEQLGVDINNVSGVQDLLLQIADAVSAGRVGRDTALYALQTLGGRTGARALNILLQGRDGIRQSQEDFAELGVLTRRQTSDLKTLAQTQTNLVNAFQTGVQGFIADNAAGLNAIIVRITSSLPALFERIGNAVAFVIEHGRLLLIVLAALALRAASGSVFGRLASTALLAGKTFAAVNLSLTAVRSNYVRVAAAANFSGRAFVTSGISGVTAAVRTAAAWVRTNTAMVRTITLTQAVAVSFRTSAAVALTAVRALAAGIIGLSRLLLRVAWPLVVIEGIIRTIQLIGNLRRRAMEIGETLPSLLQTLFAAAVGKLVDGVTYVIQQIVSLARRAANSLVNFFASIPDAMEELTRELIDTVIARFINPAKQRLREPFIAFLDSARDAADRVITILTEFGEFTERIFGIDLFEFYRDYWSGVANLALNAFRKIVQFARDTFEALKGPLQQFAEFIGLTEGEPETVQELRNQISRLRNLIVGAEANRGFSDASRARVIRQYRTEIANLEAQIASLQTTADGVDNSLAGLSGLNIENILPDSVSIDIMPSVDTGAIRSSADAIRQTFEEATGDLSIGERIAQAIDNIGRTPAEKARARARFKAIADAASETFSGISIEFDALEEIPETVGLTFDNAMQRGVEATNRGAEAIEERLSQTASTIGNAFGNFAGSVITDFKNIGDAARQLARTIINSLVQRFVVNPISNFVGNLVGGLFPGLQDGGVGRGLTLVGEAGPEVVDFRRPGRVYSNDQLRDAIVGQAGNRGGAGPVVINLSINSADSGAVTRAVNDALPAIVETVKGVIGVDAARPSALNAQLQRAF